jgi:hypothetical protein
VVRQDRPAADPGAGHGLFDDAGGFHRRAHPDHPDGIGKDPAQSASIVLTTFTDVIGFLSFLGLAFVLTSAFGLMP